MEVPGTEESSISSSNSDRQTSSFSMLKEFHSRWQEKETPQSTISTVKEFAMDGHEKVATKCNNDVPARGGRPRKDGSQRLANTGWFMEVIPRQASSWESKS